MALINKDKVLQGVGKAVDAANNAADKTENFIKENEIDKKVVHAGKTLESGLKATGEKLEETFTKLL